MQTATDCLPCFLRQALRTARLSHATPDEQLEIIRQVSEFLPSVDFAVSPPENAIKLYQLIAVITGCADPFAAIKKESNRFALHIKPSIGKNINEADNPLLAALTFAIAGNIIDYGAPHQSDMEQTVRQALSQQFAVNDFAELQNELSRADNILYLADNSGEIVFDGMVIEKLNKQVTLAVKEKAIINDALPEDAEECGLPGLCRVITNGTGCPGTALSLCSDEFLHTFQQADLIISKGQGNFETLSQIRAPIFFLLTVKCPVVQRHIGAITGREPDMGRMVLMKAGGWAEKWRGPTSCGTRMENSPIIHGPEQI